MTDSVCTEFLNDESIDFSNKMQVESSKVRLLEHYRRKVATHQEERAEWLAKLEGVQHAQEGLHALMEKLTGANAEIYRLQAKLSTVQDTIFAEKHQTLKMLQENKELKLQQIADKKRLQEFVALTREKPQTQTFYQDKRPGTAKGGSKKSECNWCAICKEYSGPKHNHFVGKTTSLPKAVVRTVYLPNEELNSMVVEIDMIKDQIEQERDAFESELQALAEEQQVRAKEKEMRALADGDRIKEMAKLAEDEEAAKNSENKTYLRLRYELQESEKELRSKIREMQEKLEVVRGKYVESKNLAKVETKEEERQADKKTDEFSYKFRKQVIKHEENIQVIKEQYAELQVKFSEKIESLEQNIANLTQSYRDLEEKRRISKNKLNREIDGLQERLRQLESENREKNNLKVVKNKRNDD
jgi:coiled-coil domain-containing protein 77